jgi:DNA repair protein RAD16
MQKDASASVKAKGKGKARAVTPVSEPENGNEFDESSGTSGSEFVASEEDDTEDEEIMVDAAVQLSLQDARRNNASTSSSRAPRPSAAAVSRAAVAEKRIARSRKALTRAIRAAAETDSENQDDEDARYSESSESDSAVSSSGSESEETPLAKKKVIEPMNKAVFMTLLDMKENRKQYLADRRELKKEHKALAQKLGRRLTHVCFLLCTLRAVFTDFIRLKGLQ